MLPTDEEPHPSIVVDTNASLIHNPHSVEQAVHLDAGRCCRSRPTPLHLSPPIFIITTLHATSTINKPYP